MEWRTLFCYGILATAASAPFFSFEEFPFSNYPMYSEARLNAKRLTILIESEKSTMRAIRNDELYPMKRIHLGYMLKEARTGVPAAQKSIAKIIENFAGHAHIALVALKPSQSPDAPFEIESYEILPTESFIRNQESQTSKEEIR